MGASVDPSSLRKTNETAAQSTQPHPLRTQASQKCGYWRCPALLVGGAGTRPDHPISGNSLEKRIVWHLCENRTNLLQSETVGCSFGSLHCESVVREFQTCSLY